MEAFEAERIRDQEITRVYMKDGGSGSPYYTDFKTVRAALALPFGSSSGVILIGGEKKDTGLIKVLAEEEFQNMFDLPEILMDLKKRYGFYCVYHGKDPETEEAIGHLKKKYDSVLSSFHCLFLGLQGSESYNFEIQMVNHLFKQDKLVVPKNGTLATELEAGWESFLASEQKLRGILALFWLVIGIDKGDSVWLCGGESVFG